MQKWAFLTRIGKSVKVSRIIAEIPLGPKNAPQKNMHFSLTYPWMLILCQYRPQKSTRFLEICFA